MAEEQTVTDDQAQQEDAGQKNDGGDPHFDRIQRAMAAMPGEVTEDKTPEEPPPPMPAEDGDDSGDKPDKEGEKTEEEKPAVEAKERESEKWAAIVENDRRVREKQRQLQQQAEQLEQQRLQAQSTFEALERVKKGDYEAAESLGIDYTEWTKARLGQPDLKAHINPLQEQVEQLKTQLEQFQTNQWLENHRAQLRSAIAPESEGEDGRWNVLASTIPDYEQQVQDLMAQKMNVTGVTPQFADVADEYETLVTTEVVEAIKKSPKLRKMVRKALESGAAPNQEETTSADDSTAKATTKTRPTTPNTLTNNQAAEISSRGTNGRTRSESARAALAVLEQIKI